MRILVTSDSHGDELALREAVLSQPRAEVVIFLGDGEKEAEKMKLSFPEKMFLLVRGNCDWNSQLPVQGEIELSGAKIFYTHGHLYSVKSGTYQLERYAGEHKFRIALYGHTHTAEARYEDGLYIMNPGALSGYNASFGTIDITGSGILMNMIQKK